MESVSKLQAKVQALSGVNILDESGSYKETYQILYEIGQVWEDMADIDQAALLELLAGKNRANVLAAIIGNMSDLEGAYEDALDAEGSATRENEKYLDSIQGRIDILTNEMQSMWMDGIPAETVKTIIDIGTGFIRILDAIGPISAVLASIAIYFTLIKKNNPIAIFKDARNQAKDFLSVVNQINAIRSFGKVEGGGMKFGFDTEHLATYAKLVKELSADKQVLALSTAGLNKEQIAEVLQLNNLTQAEAAQAISKAKLNEKKKESVSLAGAQVAASLKEQGVTLSESASNWLAEQSEKDLTKSKIEGAVASKVLKEEEGDAILATLGLGAAAKATGAALKAMIASNPVGFAITVITTLIGLVAPLIASFKSAEEKAKELDESIKSLRDTAKTVSDEFKSLAESSEEVIPRFAELAKGVDEFGNNVKLTDEEYKEFLKLNNQIADMFPEINLGLDSNGNTMLALSYTAETLTDRLNDLLEAQRKLANEKIAETMPELVEKINERNKTYDAELQTFEARRKQIIDIYNKYKKDPTATAELLGDYSSSLYKQMGFDGKSTMVGYADARGAGYVVDFSSADPELIARNYENMLAVVAKEIENVNNKKKSLWGGLNPVVSAWLSTDFAYNELSEDLQTAVIKTIGAVDFTSLGAKTADDIKNYIQNDIIYPIESMSAAGQDALSGIFNLDSNNTYGKYLADYEKHMATLTAELGKDTAGVIAQSVTDNMTDVEAAYLQVKNIVADEYDDMVDQMSVGDIMIAYTIDAAEGSMTIGQLQKEVMSIKTEPFDISEYGESIDLVQERISEYDSALKSLQEGTFTYSDFIDLTQKFPKLAKGVDISTKSFKGLEKNLKRAIKAAPEELVDELQNLRKQLLEAGKSTDELDQLITLMENTPTDTIEKAAREYSTLTDEINAAKQAQNELQEAMSENPNEGYETRGEAMEYMKDKLSRGEKGSESEVWDVAKEYGFTYDSAKSIDENADALAKFIAIREKWFKKDDDGNYTFDGTEDFIQSVENAVAGNEKLQSILQWGYNDQTGEFSFDFDNKNFEEIVKLLSQTEELAGLTEEEFSDMLVQIGQYYGITWGRAKDVIDEINSIATSADGTGERISAMTDEVDGYLDALGKDIDLNVVTEEDVKKMKDLTEETKLVLIEYIKLRDEIKNNPLNIDVGGDIENDVIKPLEDAGLAVKRGFDDLGNNTYFIDIPSLDTLLAEKGYNSSNIMAIVNKIFGEGTRQSVLAQARQDVLNLGYASEETKQTLTELGIEYQYLESSSGAQITITSNVDAVLRTLYFTDDQIAQIKQQWQENGIQINTSVNTDGVEDSQDALSEIPENVETTLSANTDKFNKTIDDAKSNLDELLIPRTATITINKVTRESTVKEQGETNTAVDWAQRRYERNSMVNVNGTAHAHGSWGATESGPSLMGELGPELLIRGNRWETVGENGAEFHQVRKGDIIFNHKQTEQLLKNGYVTGRGKLQGGGSAFASGNAFAYGSGSFSKYAFSGNGGYVEYDVNGNVIDSFEAAGGSLSSAAGDISDAADEFREVFDWIEVRLEEINEKISLRSAELENAVGYSDKNAIIDDMIVLNQRLYDNLIAGANKYYDYAKTLLAKVPEAYRTAAQDGTIAIEEFVGEVDEETLNAIQEYRDWVQKGADATQQAEETLTEIASLAKQAFDNIVNYYDNLVSIVDSRMEQLEANNELLETTKGYESEDIYRSLMKEAEEKLGIISEQRDKMQAELDNRVASGEIDVDSDAWYEAVNAIAEVDAEIIQLNTDIANYQDAINELHWEHFEDLIGRFQAVANEAENLIDILKTKDVVDELGNWTDEGITALALYAQQMEAAEMQAEKYAQEIEYLNENWQALGYTEQEYVEKLEELKDGQYDAIKSYEDAKEAIVDLNKERIDAIKNGIEKEIDAYSELIEKKKEALDSEKDLHDFQKSVLERQKDIADIERQLSALAGDNSASARAKRAQLEAELAEAKQELEEQYYDRSISNQQEALDKELETYKEEKDKEMEKLDEYLENMELVVADSLDTVQDNTSTVYDKLTEMGETYSLAITDALIKPWLSGEAAIQNYGVKLAMSLVQFSGLLGMTVDQFAAKLGMTTEQLVASLDVTVAQMAETLGLTTEQLAAKLGITTTELEGMMGLNIQTLASNMGYTLTTLAEKLGVTTADLAGNLDITMVQFAGKMGMTIDELANKVGLTVEDLASKLGMTYKELTEPFGLSMSSTIEELKKLEAEYNKILESISKESKKVVSDKKNDAPIKVPDTKNKPVTIGSRINAGSAKIYSDSYGGGGGKQYYASDPNYVVIGENNGYVLVRHHKLSSGYTGWFKKGDIKAYATGTTGTKKDELAWIDEDGLEEIVLHAGPNGRLQYLSKGSSVIPNAISENLMRLGALDPQEVLDRNRPVISPGPHIINNEIKLDCSVGTLVNIEHCDQSTLPDVERLVNKAFEKQMQNINNSLRRFTR